MKRERREGVVVCSPELGIGPEANLGGEVYDRETIKALCQLGIKVLVVLPKNKTHFTHRNLKVYYLPFSFVWPPYLFNLLIIPYLFWLKRKEEFNVLRIHSPYFVGLGALFFKIFYPKTPLITTYHHLEKNKLFHLINKLFIRQWDRIIADSRFCQKEIRNRYKVSTKKIKIVSPGLTRDFKPAKKKEELMKRFGLVDQLILLYLGQLSERKNVQFLLEVLKEISSPKVKLLIAGRGPEEKRLKAKARSLGLGKKVIFAGLIPEKEKADFYNLGDVFLLPSQKEGFGMTVVEAAACGLPAIVSDNSSLKEVIEDGKTGFLAETNNLEDWKSKINKLLGDKELREKMGRQARKFSQKFSWQKAAEKRIKIYRSLARER